MLLLALDPSLTIVGYSVFYLTDSECSLITYGRLKLNLKLDYFDRILTFDKYINDILTKYSGIEHIIIEDIQYQKKIGVSVYRKLAYLQFYLRYYFLCKQIETELVQVNSWRSVVGEFCNIKRNNKLIWNKFVNDQFNLSIKLDNNVTDAIGIGLWKCLNSDYKNPLSHTFLDIIKK